MLKEGKTTLASPQQQRGAQYETLAWSHLQRAGLRLLERNYSSRYGEIDLICLDHNTLVFVEVRFRRSANHGHPLATVTPGKQRRIIQAAKVYLQRKQLYGQMPCRFDVVGVTLQNGRPAVDWIRHAFQ